MKLRAALLLSIAATVFLLLPVWSRSFIGMSIFDAEKQDFFNWFHFAQYESKAMPDDTTIVGFKTGVKQYSVQLAVIVDKNRNIVNMALVLPRKFIDDKTNGVLARDVAKSFIAAAIADKDLKFVQSLIAELEFGNQTLKPVNIKAAVVDGEKTPDTADTVLLTKTGKVKVGDQAWLSNGAPHPALPKEPSDGYLVYLGKKIEFNLDLIGCKLRLANNAFPEKLLINVSSFTPQ